jgi:hypothetical protein
MLEGLYREKNRWIKKIDIAERESVMASTL